MGAILLLRHATTDANDRTRPVVRGQLNYPINAQGLADAGHAADRLRALQDTGTQFRHIIACDMDRTRQTAEPVGRALGIQPQYTPMLRTWKLGPDIEGKPITDDIKQRIAALVRSPNRVPYGGESYNQLGARLSSFAAPFLHDGADALDLFITHGQPIRYYDAWSAAGNRGFAYDPDKAAAGHIGAEHTGLALMAPGRFEYIDPKQSTGLS